MIIGICDNEAIYRTQAQKTITDYAAKAGLNVELKTFEDGDSILAYHASSLDALFLDIELDEENGIELARRVNEKWPNCQIIYLTSYLFYATDVYTTIHTYFVLKDQFANRIDEIFQKIVHALSQQEKKLIFNVIGGSEVVLAPNEILYFERVKRTTVIVTARGEYVIWDKIADIYSTLPPLDFVRCHNSYIIYLPAVFEMKKNAFIMSDGELLAISRRYAKETREAFTKWSLTQIS